MHRLSRTDLEALVFVAIATAPSAIKRGLKSKLLTEHDQARAALARMICDRIDNASSMVIVTEMIGEAHRRYTGEWGVDEPVPAVVPGAPGATWNG